MDSVVSRRRLFQGGGAALAGAAVLASTGPSAGATPTGPVGPGPAALGTVLAEQELVVPIWDFVTAGNDALNALGAPARRYPTSQGTVIAPVRLPVGAAIVDGHGDP